MNTNIACNSEFNIPETLSLWESLTTRPEVMLITNIRCKIGDYINTILKDLMIFFCEQEGFDVERSTDSYWENQWESRSKAGKPDKNDQ